LYVTLNKISISRSYDFIHIMNISLKQVEDKLIEDKEEYLNLV